MEKLDFCQDVASSEFATIQNHLNKNVQIEIQFLPEIQAIILCVPYWLKRIEYKL